MKRTAIYSAALLLCTLIVYWQTRTHDFINMDDDVYVTENIHVIEGLSGKSLGYALTSVDQGNYHPITWLSHMAVSEFWGMAPAWHHLVNTLFHAFSSVGLLFLLLTSTKRFWASLFVAALFALHPINTEPVAWVSARKDILCGFFYFLSLLFYCHYVRRRARVPYLCCFIAFCLALLSKPMAVTLPLVMFLMDIWPLRRVRTANAESRRLHVDGGISGLIQEKVPFLLFSLLIGTVTIYAQGKAGAMQANYFNPLALRLENFIVTYVDYGADLLWPLNLGAYYPFPKQILLSKVIFSWLVLSAVFAVAVRLRRNHPYLLFGLMWYLVTLLPVSNVIQISNVARADRYMYIPQVGLYVMTAFIASYASKYLHRKRVAIASAAIAVLVAVASLTWKQLGHWRNSVALSSHTLSVTKDNYFMHVNLGHALFRKRRVEDAIFHYKSAISINPHCTPAYNNLGVAYLEKDMFRDAFEQFRTALMLDPNDNRARQNMYIAMKLISLKEYPDRSPTLGTPSFPPASSR